MSYKKSHMFNISKNALPEQKLPVRRKRGIKNQTILQNFHTLELFSIAHVIYIYIYIQPIAYFLGGGEEQHETSSKPGY